MTSIWPLLCSTGAFTREPDHTDVRAILYYAPLLTADGFEVIFYSDWYAQHATISSALRASHLSCPVLHTEKSIGPLLGTDQRDSLQVAFDRLAINCQFAQTIGAHTVVLHLWGLPESDDYIERNLAALDECVEIAERYDLTLAVETIPCRRADPLMHIQQIIAQNARCRVALDTEFLAHHHQLDQALQSDWLWNQPDVVCHVHVKDYDGQMVGADQKRRFLHPGEGKIDFQKWFATLTQRGFCGSVSLEASAVKADGTIDLGRIQRSLAFLRATVA